MLEKGFFFLWMTNKQKQLKFTAICESPKCSASKLNSPPSLEFLIFFFNLNLIRIKAKRWFHGLMFFFKFLNKHNEENTTLFKVLDYYKWLVTVERHKILITHVYASKISSKYLLFWHWYTLAPVYLLHQPKN